jgi:hypothetical protein
MSIEDFRAGGEAHDVDLAMSACADDIVVHSPLTDRAAFTGREEVRRLFETVYGVLTNIRYDKEIGDGPTRALTGSAEVGGQRIEETMLINLDATGKISELTLFIRPLPGLTALMAALGPPLARRNGRSRFVAGLLRAMVTPLVFATRSGDRIGVPLALPAKRRVPV